MTFAFLLKIVGWLRTNYMAILAVIGLALAGAWGVYQKGVQRGYAAASVEYGQSIVKAAEAYVEAVRIRDDILAEAQGKVVEVVKWKTRTETIYQEAVKNDPACAEWSSVRIACPLGLPVDTADHPAVSRDSSKPHS